MHARVTGFRDDTIITPLANAHKGIEAYRALRVLISPSRLPLKLKQASVWNLRIVIYALADAFCLLHFTGSLRHFYHADVEVEH